MATALKVEVTEEVIARSCFRDSRHCMIAEAIQLARPDYKNVLVDMATIRWSNPRTKKRYICLTPEPARWALINFDRGEPIDPFTLNLDPIQATAMTRRGSGSTTGPVTRRQELKKRGPSTFVIEGGRPLPAGHLRGGGNRRFNEEASGPDLPDNASNAVISSRRYRKYGLGLLKE